MTAIKKGKEFNIKIGKNKCIQGFYKLGDKIKVIYNEYYSAVIMPYENAKVGLYMSLLFFLIPICFLYYLVVLA